MSVALLVLTWCGATLVLSSVPRLDRPRLAARLAPHLRGRPDATHAPDLRNLLRSRALQLGDALARAGGIAEPTGRRLERAHLPIDATTFRTRQVGRSLLAGAGAAVLVTAAGVDAAPGLAAILGATLLALLLAEQQLATAGSAHLERVAYELPVVEEQLAMLLGAGWSLGASLSRLADRSSGATARDLARVVRRIRQGVDHRRALQEWADLQDLPGIHRLVRLLVLERHGGDLSRLVADEARAARLELHRRTIEDLERRAQLVWVPVTVATLLPGVLFLAVPFLEAMRLFTG